MKFSKKTLILLFAAWTLLLSAVLPALAEEEAAPPPLSPAIEILAARTAMVKSGVVGEDIVFTSADFEGVLGYAPTRITVTSLPDAAAGTLCLGTLPLTLGATLSASTLAHLRFVPASTGVGVGTTFTFTAEGRACRTDTAIACALTTLAVKNLAPQASEQSVSTFCGVPVYEALRGVDPEQDALRFEVVRQPRKGTLTVDTATGAYVYTPKTGKKGTDVFTYRVTDVYGNESDVCKVKLNIQKEDKAVRYTDLEGHWACRAAMTLAHAGVLVGEQQGDAFLFRPDKDVTRGEFLMMAMHMTGLAPSETVRTTAFADDDAIPGYMKGYVAAAAEGGILTTVSADGTPVSFRCNDVITRAEAAVILDRVVKPEAEGAIAVFANMDAVPAWSRGAMTSLMGAGILTGTGTEGGGVALADPLGTVDRAQAAQMLCRVAELTR